MAKGEEVSFFGSTLKLTLMFFAPFFLVGSAIIVFFAFWEIRSHKEEQVSELRESAKSFLDLILMMRQWNSDHGGVYVEVTEATQPNPYLTDEDRDIETANGRKYTKINPAYMTRQISELANKAGGIKFHLKSLTPTNPDNMADPWEAEAIRTFMAGGEEKHDFVLSGGKSYFRYMVPVAVTRPCLGCHEGNSINDIRGGLSITIPIRLSDALYGAKLKRAIASFALVGALAMAFVFAATWALSRKLSGGIRRELEHEKLKSAVRIAAAAAHELRQPMTVIAGFSELMRDKLSRGEDFDKEADIIVEQCFRMNGIITNMLNITAYKTKSYGEETEIFDLENKTDKK